MCIRDSNEGKQGEKDSLARVGKEKIPGDIRLVYLMNDAVESFLIFRDARLTGSYPVSYTHLQPDRSLLDVLELNEEVNDIFSNQRLTGILGRIAYDSESLFTVAEDGTYGMGVLAGTVTGEYEAGFLGTKAREKHRQAKIEECRQRITELETALQQLEELHRKLSDRKVILRKEYDNLPDVYKRQVYSTLLIYISLL